jgi:tRNA dimethylallyltransferase
LVPILVVVGPTASGKTELALDLARRLDGEVVNADSVQVYRHFDIGSGKPTAEERGSVTYHLLDCAEPEQLLDAAWFAELAHQRINEIQGRGRTPIVAGGTFLWVRALIYGLAEAPPGDANLRARHREKVDAEGRAALHAELARVDPESAARLAPNDFVRVSRALEVYELTSVPLSRWQAQHGFRSPRISARLVGVSREREELDRRIAARIDAMFDQGFLAEVRGLIDRGYGDTRPMASVGYRQVRDALRSGEAVDLAVLKDAIYRATRTFARRQRTWLRDQSVTWVTSADDLIKEPEFRASRRQR